MQKFTYPFLIAGTLVMIYIMMKTGAPLTTPATPMGAINLELAYDKPHTDTVLTAWASDPIHNAAETNTLWDFVFLFFYSTFLYMSCKKLSNKFIVHSWKYNAGRFFARTAIIAGLLDIGENIGMLVSLKGKGGPAVSLITASCSAIKWSLVILVLLYVIIALVSKRQTARA